MAGNVGSGTLVPGLVCQPFYRRSPHTAGVLSASANRCPGLEVDGWWKLSGINHKKQRQVYR